MFVFVQREKKSEYTKTNVYCSALFTYYCTNINLSLLDYLLHVSLTLYKHKFYKYKCIIYVCISHRDWIYKYLTSIQLHTNKNCMQIYKYNYSYICIQVIYIYIQLSNRYTTTIRLTHLSPPSSNFAHRYES